MSGTAPMSPSTSPDTTVNPGGSASAPAGMVSGDGSHLNTGTTPVFNMAGPQGPPLVYGPGVSADPLQGSGVSVDPLQGPGDPWATTPWISFSPSTSPAGLPGSHTSGSTGTWQTGNSGQSGTSAATFGLPPGFLDSGFSGQAGPAQASTTVTAVDPVMAQMLRQQMLLTQGVMDLLYRTGPGLQQQPVQQTPTVAQNSAGSSEKLTMDTKWIPAAPLPDWKSWNSRARELSGFKGWLEKFASWLCLVHDSYASELKDAMNLPYPVVIVNQDQAIRSRRLFHLLQQSFSGYSRVDNVVKSQIAFYGIQEKNGFELLRLLRREFSLMSRPEALQCREACLKYTVKKSDRHLLMDVLREIGAEIEIEGFHSMLEASLIAGQLTDLRINEGDQFLLYLRNLPDKVAEFVQLHCGATTVARVWESVVAYHLRPDYPCEAVLPKMLDQEAVQIPAQVPPSRRARQRPPLANQL